jgi:threonine synthase
MGNIVYKSTRGKEEKLTSAKAIIKGICEDGGLYVPNEIPKLDLNLSQLQQLNYNELALYIMKAFFTDFTEEELKHCVNSAYTTEKFDTAAIAPVVKVDNNLFLELFHGSTIAFKDMALSILPYLLKTAVKKENINKEVVILTATSGDTGKAALEGFSDVEGTKIIVFFPEEGVSDVQKRQMTTHKGENTYVVGIQGNFDDAQTGVKNIFNDKEMLAEMDNNGLMFSSANSINIGRLVPQVVYYFYAYCELLRKKEISVGEPMNVVVPTGNFGNILAAYFAKQMGLPINKLICASNQNNVLTDFINTGVYDARRDFYTTVSPSMDILISSNLERLLYLLSGDNSAEISKLMNELKTQKYYKINDSMKAKLGDFYGGYTSEEETLATVKKVYEESGYLMDTHTAVAQCVYEKYLKETGDKTKSVVVSTASPYKFTGAVMSAVNKDYSKYDDFELIKEMNKLIGGEVPEAIKDIESRPILHSRFCEKEKMDMEVRKILNLVK